VPALNWIPGYPKAQEQLAQEKLRSTVAVISEERCGAGDTGHRNAQSRWAKQATAEAVAAEDRARQAYCVTVDGEHTAIVRLRNELANAQFDLDQTTVRAPTGGFVTELALRPGVQVVPAPFASGHPRHRR
jgi:multidrug resistance efflux pump